MRGPIEALSLSERFWLKVKKSGPNDCWLWAGRPSRYGYGELRINGTTLKAHRISFALANGREAAFCVCHRCDNRMCVNPAHLFDGDRKANSGDMVAKGRQAKGDRLARKLTSGDVAAIRELVASGQSQTATAKRYGVGPDHVSRIIRGERWA